MQCSLFCCRYEKYAPHMSSTSACASKNPRSTADEYGLTGLFLIQAMLAIAPHKSRRQNPIASF